MVGGVHVQVVARVAALLIYQAAAAGRQQETWRAATWSVWTSQTLDAAGKVTVCVQHTIEFNTYNTCTATIGICHCTIFQIMYNTL